MTRYAYDALNRLTRVTDAGNNATLYSYDNRDNLIALTDAENQTTRFEYDRNNRLVKEIRPMGEETAYDYDGAGNLIEKIDPKNQRSEYLYDDAGRLTEISYYGADDHVNAVKTVTFSYDKAGNLTGYDDGTTSAVYTYDDAYRKTGETVHYPGYSLTSAYTYYKNGLKKSFTGPDGIVYGFLYDSNNQLNGVQIPNVGMFTVNEYKWNRPAKETLPGGAQRLYSYDELMRTAGIAARDPGGHDQLNYAYTYDKVDNITAKATSHGDYGYTYDDLYRLTDADNPDGQTDECFTYDGVGNRLTAADIAGDWAYNADNELEGYDDVTFQYDANGNMIEKNAGGVVTRFFYNLEDRLERVEDGAGSVIATYYYDPFGRRLWKDVGGTRTCFFYSDEGLVGEYDGAGAEIRTYGWKPGSTWSTDPVFMKQGSQYYWYHNDHLGTPQVMTTSSGAVVWSAKYSLFGEAVVDSSSTVVNPLRFPGQYEDAETGLHYNLWRYYDASIGRYLRTDPIGMGGGLNFYTYASVSPVNWVDMYGLDSTIPDGFWEYNKNRFTPEEFFSDKVPEKARQYHIDLFKEKFPSGWSHRGITNLGSSMRDSMGFDGPGSTISPECVKDFYCKHGSAYITVATDVVSIGAFYVVAGSGGTATPVAGTAGAIAKAISVGNGFATLMVCKDKKGLLAGLGVIPGAKGTIQAVGSLIEAEITVVEYVREMKNE